MVYRMLIGLLLLATLPVQAIIALLLLIISGRPVLFAQRRIGLNGKPFAMYKFRTMVHEAEKQKSRYRTLNESAGPAFKIYHDPRFTPLGKILSHTGLDELPQLWNVYRGDMALIGPRPLPVSEVNKLKPWMRKRHVIRPGIISPAVLTGRYHKDFNEWMKSDISYAKNKSPRVDMGLLAQSVPFLLRLMVREIRGALRS